MNLRIRHQLLRRIFWLVVGLVVAALVVPRPAIVPPIRGYIVDARNGRPLAGVNIVASWRLVRGTLGGHQNAGHLEIRDATSANDGSYEIDGFVRFYVPMLKSIDVIDSPRLFVFKPGYRPKTPGNAFIADGEDDPLRRGIFVYRSSWDGRRLELEPLAAVNELSDLRSAVLDLVRSPRACRWDRIQSMLLAIDASPFRPRDLSDVLDEATSCGQGEAFQRRLGTVNR